jgi:hypothetical protein
LTGRVSHQALLSLVRWIAGGHEAEAEDHPLQYLPRDRSRLRQPDKPHSRRRILGDPKTWMVLHQGANAAYTDCGAFERNQENMVANRTRSSGVGCRSLRPNGVARLVRLC